MHIEIESNLEKPGCYILVNLLLFQIGLAIVQLFSGMILLSRHCSTVFRKKYLFLPL